MFIAHNAAQLYRVEFGSGPHTILAHGGWTGSWELWAEPFNFLNKSWRTIAYDHRGTGATLAPVASISLENMDADIFAVMDKMDIETCVLAAESAGATVAVMAALEGPGRFDGLVLVDALLHNKDDESDTTFINGLKTNFAETIGRFADACVLAKWHKKSINIFQNSRGIYDTDIERPQPRRIRPLFSRLRATSFTTR